jgi:acetyltransferase-like isoleucine patch superfamily enzyme
VVIHAGVRIGDGCTLQDGAIVGKSPRLGPRSTTGGPIPVTTIEPGASVGCHGVVTAGTTVREGAIVGDHSFVRERADIGPESVVGAGAAIGPGVVVGRRVRLWTHVVLAPGTVIEDEADMSIGASTTSRRWEPGGKSAGVRVGRRAKVGVYAVLLAGVEVGEDAVVGANSLVNKDVAPGSVVGGTPARVLENERTRMP